MDLQISVFLLFILFTAGNSLSCYECTGSCVRPTAKTCISGYTQCMSSTTVTQADGKTSKVNGCTAACLSGFTNIGILKTSTSCCNTDLCNAQDAPDFSNVPNGKSCYYCDENSCTNIVKCSGIEDRCINLTGPQGCVSKSICDSIASVSVPNVVNSTCCEGNLCNGDQSTTTTATPRSTYTSTQSVTQNTTQKSTQSIKQITACNSAQSVSQSFLFLCCSLISYFLLH